LDPVGAEGLIRNLPVAILGASAIGYVFVFAIGLFAYVKAHHDPRFKDLERPYRAPRGWVWIALALGVMQIPLLLVGAVWINNFEYGWLPTVVGSAVLAAFFPLWLCSQYEIKRIEAREQAEKNAEPS